MVGGEGGGARTILGISYSPSSGWELLSLDPHYSGPDADLEALKRAKPESTLPYSTVALEWVEPKKLFRQYGRFVNFCMPLAGGARGQGEGGTGAGAAGGGGWDGEFEFEVVESG